MMNAEKMGPGHIALTEIEGYGPNRRHGRRQEK
jgi:hypothetical protein